MSNAEQVSQTFLARGGFDVLGIGEDWTRCSHK